jgi:hypothetical protein
LKNKVRVKSLSTKNFEFEKKEEEEMIWFSNLNILIETAEKVKRRFWKDVLDDSEIKLDSYFPDPKKQKTKTEMISMEVCYSYNQKKP